MALSRSWALQVAHLVESVGYYKRFGESWKGGLLKLREALTCFLDVQSVNQCSRLLLLVFLGSKSLRDWWGVKSKWKLQGLMKMRNCWTGSVATRKDWEAAEVKVDFLAETWNCLFGLYPYEDVASDKRLERDFCYFLCGAFLDCSAEGLILIREKSQVLACLSKSGAEKQQRFLLSWLEFLAGGSRFTWWTESRERASECSNVPQRASGLWHPFYHSWHVCGSNGATRDSWARRARQGRLGLKASNWDLLRWVIAIDELRGLWLLREQEKQSWSALLTQITLRSLKWRYSCSCFAVR